MYNFSLMGTITTTDPNFPKPVKSLDIVYGTVYIMGGVLGLLGNFLSHLFFRSKSRDLSSILYQLITLTDFLISSLILPCGVCFLRGRDPGFYSDPVFCKVWSILWYIAARLSVFLVVVLTVSRTVSIIRPLRAVSRKWVIFSIAIYFSYLLLQFTAYLLMEGISVQFSSPRGNCAILIDSDIDMSNVIRLLEASMVIAIWCPVFIVIINSAISTWALCLKKHFLDTRKSRIGQLKLRASMTILMFGLVYLIFNVPLAVYQILQTIDINLLSWDHGNEYFNYFGVFCASGCVILNAAVNPFLYYWRMDRFKEFLLDEDYNPRLSRLITTRLHNRDDKELTEV